MQDINNLQDVYKVLEEYGYNPVLNENSVSVPVGAENSPFPCLILMDEECLTVLCEIDTYGNIMSRVPSEDKEDFHVALLDLNSRMNSYAFTVLSDIDDPEAGEDKNNWIVALINSISVGDISEDELLKSIRGVYGALQSAKEVFNVNNVSLV